MKVLLGLGVTGLLLSVLFLMAASGVYNDCISNEKGIEAQYKQNQNNYDNYTKKVLEVAQVPAMYKDDLVAVTKAAISGRYGANGSKAVFQWLKEQNPSLDSSLYVQIQRVIEAGRNGFETDQKALLEKKRIYAVMVESFPNNFVARFFGFPSEKLLAMDIVTSEETEDAFKKKKSAPLKLR
jgi:hypothetical protein